MSERMISVRRFLRHFHSDKTNDRRTCVRQIVESVRHNRHAVRDHSDSKFYCKQKDITEDTYNTCQHSIRRSYRYLLYVLIIFYEMFY